MTPDARRVHAITLLITLIGAACCILQAMAPFRGIFQGLTVQVTFVAGALTYARSVRWLLDPGQSRKLRFILRGNLVVLVSVAVTLVLDAYGLTVLRPRPQWVHIAIPVLAALTLGTAAWLGLVFRGIATPTPPAGLTIADGIDDLLVLFRWGVRADSDSLFRRLRRVDPRHHPWEFASVLGIAVGAAALLAWYFNDGPPANLQVWGVILAIFVFGEVMATLAGLAALGPYLGLRDPNQ